MVGVGVGVGHATVNLQEVQSAEGDKKDDDDTIGSEIFAADIDIT